MAAKEDKKVQVRSKLFPVLIIKCNGVPIEVRPLRHGAVCEAIDFFYSVFGRISDGNMDRDFLAETAGTLNRYLNECVTVPDDPDMKIEDMAEPWIPDIVEAFLMHTLQPGNWKTLAQRFQENFGIALSQGL